MNRYLVGRSGLVAERFFGRELGVDFRRQVAIINKTPVHTPKTAQLRRLAVIYPAARAILEESQRFMAAMVPALQQIFGARVWVMGLSEVRPHGLFEPWQQALTEAYANSGRDEKQTRPCVEPLWLQPLLDGQLRDRPQAAQTGG